MNFFSKKTTWTNIEFVPLKLCIASIYILIGSYFAEYILPYWVAFAVLFIITLIVSMYLWVGKMKRENQ